MLGPIKGPNKCNEDDSRGATASSLEQRDGPRDIKLKKKGLLGGGKRHWITGKIYVFVFVWASKYVGVIVGINRAGSFNEDPEDRSMFHGYFFQRLPVGGPREWEFDHRPTVECDLLLQTAMRQ